MTTTPSAPERRVYKIDTGNATPEDVASFKQKLRDRSVLPASPTVDAPETPEERRARQNTINTLASPPFATGADNKAHYIRTLVYIREQLKLKAAAHRAYHVLMAKPHTEAQQVERFKFLYGGPLERNPHYGEFALNRLHAAYCLLRGRPFKVEAWRTGSNLVTYAHATAEMHARLELDRILALTREQSQG